MCSGLPYDLLMDRTYKLGCPPAFDSPFSFHSHTMHRHATVVPRPSPFFAKKKMGKAWEHLSHDMDVKWTWGGGGGA